MIRPAVATYTRLLTVRCEGIYHGSDSCLSCLNNQGLVKMKTKERFRV